MENNEFVIAENYTLPSNGLVYDRKVNPEIKLRSMTVREEMRRMNISSDGTTYKGLADVIDSCLVEKPGISAYDLSVGDFQFLLHKLRIVTFGPDYKVSVTCPYCGRETEVDFNLENLELTTLKDFDYNKEMFLELPYSKKVIELNVITPRILDQISLDVARVERQSRKAGEVVVKNEWTLLFQLIRAIKTVDGVALSETEKETFCNKLVGRDYNAILNRLDELDNLYGLSSAMKIGCEKCGMTINTTFRFTREFYRPSANSKN